MTIEVFRSDIETATIRAARAPLSEAERAFWLGVIYASVPSVGLAEADAATKRLGITEAEKAHFLDEVALDLSGEEA